MRALSSRSRLLAALAALLFVVLLVWWARGVGGQEAEAPRDSGTAAAAPQVGVGAGQVTLDDLPAGARETVALIDRGGPYPYPKDGTAFRNAERLLPIEAAGYYREYTVPTPGSSDRGARRLVLGLAGELYYTSDHYRSFRKIVRETGEP